MSKQKIVQPDRAENFVTEAYSDGVIARHIPTRYFHQRRICMPVCEPHH